MQYDIKSRKATKTDIAANHQTDKNTFSLRQFLSLASIKNASQKAKDAS
jgi:hypothetical protein